MNNHDKIENVKKIKELNMSRAYGYMFLKTAFNSEPSKEYIDILSKGEFLDEFPFINENNLIKEGIEEIEKYFLEKDIGSETEYSKLHWDYTRMFIGPRELPAPPWESSYMNKDKLLFQEETLQVRKSYLKYNFIPENYPHEADDHVALELDYIYRLCIKLDEALEKEEYNKFFEIIQDQRSFLEYHLTKWIPKFVKKINKDSQTYYYKGISKLLEGFIQIDYQIICELVHTFS